MGASALVVRAWLRRRRWSALATVVIVAIGAGAAIGGIAGARRTSSAFARLEHHLAAAHAVVQFENEAPPEPVHALRSLPGVERVGEVAFLLARPTQSDGELGVDVGGYAFADEVAGRAIDRLRMEAGRAPDPRSPSEAVVSPVMAQRLGLKIGDDLRLDTLRPDDIGAWFAGAERLEGPHPVLRVVGIGSLLPEVVGTLAMADGIFVTTPAFYEQHGERIAAFRGIYLMHLAGGEAGIPALEGALERTFPASAGATVEEGTEGAVDIRAAVLAQGSALWIVSAIAAAASLLAAAQALSRLFASVEGEAVALQAIGFDAAARRRVALGLSGVIAVPATALALASAAATSVALPFGLAGRLEPEPGLRVDATVLAAGGLVTLLAVVGGGVLLAVRPPRRAAPAIRSGRIAIAAGRVLRGVPATVGSRHAFGATVRGDRVAAWLATVTTLVAVVVTVGSAIFIASLDRLRGTPERYGWSFDLEVGIDESLSDEGAVAVAETLAENPKLDAVAVARVDNARIEGRAVDLFAWQQVRGELFLTVLEGRAPETDHEIALGGHTAEQLGATIGDEVTVAGVHGRPVPMRMVGLVVVPHIEADNPGRGAAVSLGAIRRFERVGSGYPDLFARARPGTDLGALVAELDDDYPFVRTAVPHSGVVNLGEIRSAPIALALVLLVLGVLALTHVLVSAIRSGRRRMAVLRALGCTRRQVAASVVWQASLVAVVAVVPGVVLGVAGGRLAWKVVAEGLNVASDPRIPALVLLAAGAGALALPNLIALVPGRRAARLLPAVALRAE